jgi:hypothetical protein
MHPLIPAPAPCLRRDMLTQGYAYAGTCFTGGW